MNNNKIFFITLKRKFIILNKKVVEDYPHISGSKNNNFLTYFN